MLKIDARLPQLASKAEARDAMIGAHTSLKHPLGTWGKVVSRNLKRDGFMRLDSTRWDNSVEMIRSN